MLKVFSDNMEIKQEYTWLPLAERKALVALWIALREIFSEKFEVFAGAELDRYIFWK